MVIADDQALVRGGFRMILDAKEDMEVVGEAGDGVEAVALAERERPDVVLMDVRMPDMDGIEATRRIVDSGSPRARGRAHDLRHRRVRVRRAARGRERLPAQGRPPAPSWSRRSGSSRAATRCSRRASPVGCSTASPARCPDGAPPTPDLDELTEREREVLRFVALGALERRDRRAPAS